jgi:hypothetical protein
MSGRYVSPAVRNNSQSKKHLHTKQADPSLVFGDKSLDGDKTGGGGENANSENASRTVLLFGLAKVFYDTA